MRNSEIVKTTTDSREYKRIRFEMQLKCSICRPNRGCNNAFGRHLLKNWKEFRKTQWKETSINVGLV